MEKNCEKNINILFEKKLLLINQNNEKNLQNYNNYFFEKISNLEKIIFEQKKILNLEKKNEKKSFENCLNQIEQNSDMILKKIKKENFEFEKNSKKNFLLFEKSYLILSNLIKDEKKDREDNSNKIMLLLENTCQKIYKEIC